MLDEFDGGGRTFIGRISQDHPRASCRFRILPVLSAMGHCGAGIGPV